MSKISIVGVEGSGKTVMMAAFGDKYKHPASNTIKGDKEETPRYIIGFRLALAPIARAEEQ